MAHIPERCPIFPSINQNNHLWQWELVSNENGQTYFNDKPNMSPLDEKQTAPIKYIRIKIVLVPNKIFMNMIENKYGNKTYFEYEIIINEEI